MRPQDGTKMGFKLFQDDEGFGGEYANQVFDGGGGGGMGLGSLIAVVISWSANHSIWWCIVHGVGGGAYVIYYACGYGR